MHYKKYEDYTVSYSQHIVVFFKSYFSLITFIFNRNDNIVLQKISTEKLIHQRRFTQQRHNSVCLNDNAILARQILIPMIFGLVEAVQNVDDILIISHSNNYLVSSFFNIYLFFNLFCMFLQVESACHLGSSSTSFIFL